MDIRSAANRDPDKVAVRFPALNQSLSYSELEEQSERLASALHTAGLRRGDGIALLMDNEPALFTVAWAAQRSGLYYTTVNPRLTVAEAAYLVSDSGAAVVLCSAELADLGQALVAETGSATVQLVVTGATSPTALGLADFRLGAAADVTSVEGADMLYSSGTTGRPKGVRQPLTGAPFGAGTYPVVDLLRQLYGMSADSVYLSPAPLYHSAPLRFCMAAQRLGAEVVCMRRFDPELMLQLIESHRVTHLQVVPTMLVRLLKLPEQVRASYDLSSLQAVVHAAAPCPQHVKRAVIEWLGPIVHEYYSGTEGVGFCAIDSLDWLAHPGSVGRPLSGAAHVCDDEGTELPAGEVGTVWFETTSAFAYHGDPDKTSAAHDPRGWATLGDIGSLDEEGYLYLTDRRVDLILSGGVNIYPQEIENVLLAHPAVLDVAVVGQPDEDFGQRVEAYVQPAHPDADPDLLAEELDRHCRAVLAGYKCPREFTVLAELPRFPDGKLRRRMLRKGKRPGTAGS